MASRSEAASDDPGGEMLGHARLSDPRLNFLHLAVLQLGVALRGRVLRFMGGRDCASIELCSRTSNARASSMRFRFGRILSDTGLTMVSGCVFAVPRCKPPTLPRCLPLSHPILSTHPHHHQIHHPRPRLPAAQPHPWRPVPSQHRISVSTLSKISWMDMLPGCGAPTCIPRSPVSSVRIFMSTLHARLMKTPTSAITQ